MLRKLIVFLGTITLLMILAVGGLLIYIAMQPGDFSVERSQKIDAPPGVVFDQVNNFRNWQAWSPWEKMDPNLKKTYEGKESGEGAIYSWKGNEVGEGRMEIVESKPNDLIKIKLDFIAPFKATNTVTFTFKADGNATDVTWNMSGQKNFFLKVVGLFTDMMDKMIGGQFEQGLIGLKAAAEGKQGP